MIKVPVLLNFEYTKQIATLEVDETQIATLEVDETQLPPVPNFCFSIGFSPLNSDPGEYTLVCVSPVMDDLYKKYYVPIGNF